MSNTCDTNKSKQVAFKKSIATATKEAEVNIDENLKKL